MPGIFSDVFSGGESGQSSDTNVLAEGEQALDVSPEVEIGYEASYQDLEGGSHTTSGELQVGAGVNLEAAYQASIALANEGVDSDI